MIKESLQKSGGIIKIAALKLNVSRRVLYEWISKSEELKEALMDARESLLDSAEGMLQNQIKEGNLTAIIFYLKTQGKNRGYVERDEHQLSLAPQPIQYLDVSTYKEVEE